MRLNREPAEESGLNPALQKKMEIGPFECLRRGVKDQIKGFSDVIQCFSADQLFVKGVTEFETGTKIGGYLFK